MKNRVAVALATLGPKERWSRLLRKEPIRSAKRHRYGTITNVQSFQSVDHSWYDKGSFCVSKVEGDHRLMTLNLEEIEKLFHLPISHSMLYFTALWVEVRESQGPSAAWDQSSWQGQRHWKAKPHTPIWNSTWPRDRNLILRFKVTGLQRSFQNRDQSLHRDVRRVA